jgi:hypothetical protein
MRRGLLIPLVASLFVLSFIESWAALLDAARAAGIPYPEPWPWMVDGFIVATALLVVEARRAGHAAGVWWPRLGLLGATALSTSIQATWAPQGEWAWALHAWSPLAVLFSFECLVWLVFAPGQARAQRASGPAVPARLHTWLRSWELPDPPAPPAPVVPLQPVARPARRAAGPISGRDRARVAAWLGEDPPRSARWIAGQLGLSNHARSAHLAPLIEELQASRVGGPAGNGERP